MFYKKSIFQIDNEGHFLVAVYFSQYLNLEATRESNQAYFAYGHIDAPDQLTDLTALCCLSRKACNAEKKMYLKQADTQKGIKGDYAAKQHKFYLYQAELATNEALFVPSLVQFQGGKLYLGYDIENHSGRPIASFKKVMGQASLLRVIDIQAQTLIFEQIEPLSPKAAELVGIQALTNNGNSVIRYGRLAPHRDKYFEQTLMDRQTTHIFPKTDGKIEFIQLENQQLLAVKEKSLSLYDHDRASTLCEYKLPNSMDPWDIAVSKDSQTIALAGNCGLIIVMNLDNGETKKYYPHRGCKRDDFAEVQLSQSGQWMASKIVGESALIITDLKQGTTWKVADIEGEKIVEREEEGFVFTTFVPSAFAFINDRCIVSDKLGIREIDYQKINESTKFVSEQGKPGARKPLKISSKTSIEKIIQLAELERVKEHIQQSYFPAVKLMTKKSKQSGWKQPEQKGAPSLGESRLGGWPDLTSNTPWPTWENRPMSFLGQINLTDVHEVQSNIRLPKEGVLLFFLGCDDEVSEFPTQGRSTYFIQYYFEDAYKEAPWKVVYASPEDLLKRTIYEGEIAPALFEPSLVRLFKSNMFLPHEETSVYECFDFTPDERDRYNEVLNVLHEEVAENQLSGYPNIIQSGSIEMECVLNASGENSDNSKSNHSNEHQNKLLDQSQDWGLLLQLTSDDNVGFGWGEAGHLYFYGKKEEMEIGCFDNIYVYYEN